MQFGGLSRKIVLSHKLFKRRAISKPLLVQVTDPRAKQFLPHSEMTGQSKPRPLNGPQEMSPLSLGLIIFSVRNLISCQPRTTSSNRRTNLSGCSALSWRCSVLRTVISKMTKIR